MGYDDGSCVAFTYGPIYKALARPLAKKKWAFIRHFLILPKGRKEKSGLIIRYWQWIVEIVIM